MFYKCLRAFVRFILAIFFRFEVIGKENVPEEGGVILASNHISLLDPVFIGCALERQVHFMAKEELFHVPIISTIIKHAGTFAVKRGTGDRGAIRQAIQIVSEGRILCLFPEGTRSKTGELQAPRPGVAMIALKANTPVVPVGVIGTNKLFKKGAWLPWLVKVTVHVGKPIYFVQPEAQPSKTDFYELSNRIMKEIALLLKE